MEPIVISNHRHLGTEWSFWGVKSEDDAGGMSGSPLQSVLT